MRRIESRLIAAVAMVGAALLPVSWNAGAFFVVHPERARGGALAEQSIAQVESTTVAMVRPDSVLLPFARFARGRWIAPGQESPADSTGELAEQATAWFASNGPASPLWFMWLNPDSLVTIRTSGTRSIGAHCQNAWALSTDFTGPRRSGGEPHFNIGFAADVRAAIVAAEPLSDTSSLWREAAELIRASFAASESAYLATREEWLLRHFRQPPTGRFDIAVTRVSAPSDTALYHVLAERDYDEARTPGSMQCPVTSRLNAWARADSSGRLQLFGLRHEADLCDRKGMPNVRALAAARLAGRNFVFIEERYYEWEKYAIHEVLPRASRRVLTVDAGGC